LIGRHPSRSYNKRKLGLFKAFGVRMCLRGYEDKLAINFENRLVRIC